MAARGDALHRRGGLIERRLQPRRAIEIDGAEPGEHRRLAAQASDLLAGHARAIAAVEPAREELEGPSGALRGAIGTASRERRHARPELLRAPQRNRLHGALDRRPLGSRNGDGGGGLRRCLRRWFRRGGSAGVGAGGRLGCGSALGAAGGAQEHEQAQRGED